jgi:hypothetical protein
MSITVAVIGAGRMGSVVTRQLPPNTKKIIIDTDLAKASELAKAVGGSSASELEYAKDADLIAVVLPTPAINETVEKLQALVKKGAVIINMATTAKIDPVILVKNPDIFIVDTKIIGHARSISKGEPGIVVAKTENDEVLAVIKSQLIGFTDVVRGDADLVPIINTIGSTEGIKTALAIRKKLRAMDIPDEWINVVIRTVCAGTMKSFTENDLGHFALELLKKLESEDQ